MIEKLAMKQREKSHEARANLFMKLMSPAPGAKVLDLGSGYGKPFMTRIFDKGDVKITLADISDGHVAMAKKYGFDSVALKEGEPLPFKDKEYDIVFSNSVIEHVTLPKHECMKSMPEKEWKRKSWESQKNFSNEIRRIGKSYFVQTPHKNFPFDMHLWLPFTNFLPHAPLQSITKFTEKYWIKKCEGATDWNLLGPGDMKKLFPESNIYVEKLFGLPKSVIAYYLGA